MTALEHQELKGITVKNLVVTIVSTASIVVSVMTTYFDLRNDIHDIKTAQETQARINDIRLKVLEGEMSLLQKQIDELKPIDRTYPTASSSKNIWPAFTSTAHK